jgi:hypothetical protein
MDIRQTVTIERERLQQSRQLDNVSRSLQKTMAELLSIEELDVPADLGDITSTWLQRQIDECTAPIKADKSLTSDERRERLKPWKALRQRALRLVDVVQGILLANPDTVFTVEDDEDGQPHYYISEAQIEDVARQRATHPVPAEALQHLDLIQQVREAVENLREFEDKHNVRRYTVEQLLHLPWSCGLCDMWVTGDIFKDAVEEKYKNFFPTYKQSKEYFQHKQQIKNQ